MGFIYNNTWEGFCKTYFELHGYFVTTNLFAALLRPEDARSAVALIQTLREVISDTFSELQGLLHSIEPLFYRYHLGPPFTWMP